MGTSPPHPLIIHYLYYMFSHKKKAKILIKNKCSIFVAQNNTFFSFNLKESTAAVLQISIGRACLSMRVSVPVCNMVTG